MYTNQEPTKEGLCEELEGDIRSIKKINGVNDQLESTGTLATTFHKPAGEASPYVWFGFVLQTIFNHTREQVLVPMNSDRENAKK